MFGPRGTRFDVGGIGIVQMAAGGINVEWAVQQTFNGLLCSCNQGQKSGVEMGIDDLALGNVVSTDGPFVVTVVGGGVAVLLNGLKVVAGALLDDGEGKERRQCTKLSVWNVGRSGVRVGTGRCKTFQALGFTPCLQSQLGAVAGGLVPVWVGSGGEVGHLVDA